MKKNIIFLTLRNVQFWHFYQIVYEWEDEICKQLNIKIQNLYPNKKYYNTKSILGILFLLYKKYKINYSKNLFIYFEMGPKRIITKLGGVIKINPNINNNNRSIPIIIDFFLKKEELNLFYKSYSKVPFLFVTSAEVYSFLKENKCPLKIYHLPLSIPNKYQLDKNIEYEKKYNLALIGRTNPFLLDCLNKYCKSNPNFIYLYQQNIKGSLYYITNKGEIIGQFNSRESYIYLIRSTKIAFYSTLGIDTKDNRSNGYNPISPRLFELMAAQCFILAVYPDNEETQFYQLNKIIPSIKNYSEFENLLSRYLKTTTYPKEEYGNFLSKHYTSLRAFQLIDRIKDLQ